MPCCRLTRSAAEAPRRGRDRHRARHSRPARSARTPP
jgi:hypothetical protein